MHNTDVKFTRSEKLQQERRDVFALYAQGIITEKEANIRLDKMGIGYKFLINSTLLNPSAN